MTPAAITAADLAAAAKITKRAIQLRAEAEGWPYTVQIGPGGERRLYAVDQLPSALRPALWTGPPRDDQAHAAALAGRADAGRVEVRATLDRRAADARRHGALRQAAELSPGAQARMDARLAVVRAYEQFALGMPGLSREKTQLLFAERYTAAAVPDRAPAVRKHVPSLTDRTLRRWQRDMRTHGVAALAGNYGNRAGSRKVDADAAVHAYVQAMLVQYPHARAAHVMRGLQARFGQQPGSLPGMRALERWIAAWRRDNAEVLLALANPDAWKNQHMVAFGSASAVATAINELWELDSSPADVLCTDGRHAVIAGIDVATRRARILVVPTSRAVGVATLLRAMLLAYGVPAACKTDNGSDYTSAHVTRVLAGLDVRHELCPPFQPWHKPHVERFFRTFAHGLVELLPGYIGHSVAERQAIEARKSFADRLLTRGETVDVRMTGAELQAFADQWLDGIYHVEPHAGLGRISPLEAAAAQQAQVRRVADEHALDILLAEAPERGGLRTVQKKGISVFRTRGTPADMGWYIAPELEAWVGRVVQVRYDPIHHDLGTVYVFCAETGRFVCLAQDPHRTGIDRREVAIKAKTMQRERVQAARRALRAGARRVGVDDAAQEILRERAAAAGKLALLPARQAQPHDSAGLQAAAAAARQAQAPQRTTADIEQLAEVRAMQARIAAEQVPAGTPSELAARRGAAPTPVFETVAQRVQWLLGQARVRALGAEEQDALARYRAEHPASYRRLEGFVAEQIGPEKKNAPEAVAGPSGAV